MMKLPLKKTRLHFVTTGLSVISAQGKKSLTWTSHGAAYCQLIHMQYKDKCLQLAREHLDDELTDAFGPT